MSITNSGTSTSHLVEDNSATFNATGTGLTLCVWLKRGAYAGYSTFFNMNVSGGSGSVYYAGIAPTTSYPFLYNSNGGTFGYGPSTAIDDDAWWFFAARIGTDGKILTGTRRYDAASISWGTESAASTLHTTHNQTAWGGCKWQPTENWDGEIGNAILYKGVLTQDEMDRQSRMRLPVRPDLVRVWHPFLAGGSVAEAIADAGPNAFSPATYNTISTSTDEPPVPWGAPLILVPQSAAPQTYTAAVAESQTLTDTAAGAGVHTPVAYAAAVTESQTPTDTATGAGVHTPVAYSAAVTESQTPTDVVAGSGVHTPVAYSAAVTESQTPTDAAAGGLAALLRATPPPGRRLRIAARVNGRLVIGSYGEVARLVGEVAQREAVRVQPAPTRSQRSKQARRSASENLPSLIDIVEVDTDVVVSRDAAAALVAAELQRQYEQALRIALNERAAMVTMLRAMDEARERERLAHLKALQDDEDEVLEMTELLADL